MESKTRTHGSPKASQGFNTILSICITHWPLRYWNRICEPKIAVRSVKSSGSMSSRLQQKNLELEKRSRLPIPPDSSNSRRQPNKQQPESSFPAVRLNEDGVSLKFGSVAPEHPSPVSILDDTMYRDDALSPMKQMPDVLKAMGKGRVIHQPSQLDQYCRDRIYCKGKICANHGAYEEFVSRSSSINTEYEAKACDTQVDQLTSTTPKLKIVAVPSLASIEEMRTPVFGDLMENFTRPNLGCTESKIQQHRQRNNVVGFAPYHRRKYLTTLQKMVKALIWVFGESVGERKKACPICYAEVFGDASKH
ncbi:hypothetical protein LOK49_LG02G00529 [Camellia lanceoleosa]|uniref:Uncharacterized protein n=1 Tax=Camellia lanceoleosa TaxID=1840588 RepID=A0ACC0IM24_9ERIC|nr:hypothetical protein LOK49_LG02G00529 [Camellia lanceoleosa]